jgi:transcriptional regulator with XRE-family HTH domain
MPNDRFRDALFRAGMTPDQLAEQLGVDPKTVERWITAVGRTPYPRHRHKIAAILQESESYLWPDALPPERRVQVAQSELVAFYPHRAESPADIWMRLLGDATEQIEVLVYAGLFLPEQNPRLVKMLKSKAEAGTRIRLLFGDPDSPQVLERGREEGIGDAIPPKIRNVLVHYEKLRKVDNVDVRLHRTNLYASIYRFDNEMLVNAHVYGFPGAHAPLLHVRRLAGGDLFDTYVESYEHVWSESFPAWSQ